MISVCMATYNGERFVKQQIDSILCQLDENDELIISDDGSTDKTLEIIESYCDKRIKVLHHFHPILKKNLSQHLRVLTYATSNFENALLHCNGDIIYLSDQDDIWPDNKVSVCNELLKEHDFVMTNFSIIDDNGRIQTNRYYKSKPFFGKVIKDILHPHYIGCCCCFSKKLLDQALPFPKHICCHDLWLGCIASRFFHPFFYEESLLFHRVGISNTSTATKQSENTMIEKFLYRVPYFINIFRRKKICRK